MKIEITEDKNELKEQVESIFKYWPFPEYDQRKSQKYFLNWLSELPSDIKYILLELPVGGGKSPLALNTSGWYNKGNGSSYILTPQKVLQKQYEDSFTEKQLFSLYGKANYTCKKRNTNCEIGSKIKPKCETCPARDAMVTAFKHNNTVMNYTLGLLHFKLAEVTHMKPRTLIVFDECHQLEQNLIDFDMITVTKKKCKKYEIKYEMFDNLIDTISWFKNVYLSALNDKMKQWQLTVQEIKDAMEFSGKSHLSMEETKIINDYETLVRHAEAVYNITTLPRDYILDKYVLVNDSGKSYFNVKQLYGKEIFKDLVEPMGEKFLFMSSTILNKVSFCKDLGLDPKKTAFLSLPSEFKKKKRPVIYMPQMKMSYGWDKPEKKNERREMLDTIKWLSDDVHKEHKGIIHTANFKVAEWLVTELTGNISHKIYHHNPSSEMRRDDVLEIFQKDEEPSILISPSITEGLDLKDDKGRFAIFAKVPFPFLGDSWVKRRMELSQEWYNRHAMIALIQGAGRVVRSKEDWGNTYILDASFNYLYNQYFMNIPKWWKDALEK